METLDSDDLNSDISLIKTKLSAYRFASYTGFYQGIYGLDDFMPFSITVITSEAKAQLIFFCLIGGADEIDLEFEYKEGSISQADYDLRFRKLQDTNPSNVVWEERSELSLEVLKNFEKAMLE